jgi:ADP-heptose:LPS heptosyltransferase
VTPQTVPNAPYLTASAPPPALPPGLRVGLMTRGAAHYGADATRSLSDEAAEALRALPAAAMVDLAPEATGARDFADTAAIVQALDLVISVDTAVAHLAGAMGKPVWILLPAENTDWRWLRERRDSPWYPTARLYRQAPGEGWEAVVAAVLRDLAARLPRP